MNDLELDRLLDSARSSVTLPPGFQRDVWLRIETAEEEAWSPRLVVERFFNWLALPPVAFAACGVMLAAGIWAGFETGKPSQRGEVAYIQSVSPFARTHR